MANHNVKVHAPDQPGASWPCRVPGERLFKFRAWDLTEKKMIDEPEAFAAILFDAGTAISRRYRLMQWTGLADKVAVEVYEGDVVEAWSAGAKGRFEVRWRQDGWPCFILFPAYFDKDFWGLHGSNQGGVYYDTGLQVIGNVYMTPLIAPRVPGECRWCRTGSSPQLLDDNGISVEVSGLPGRMRHSDIPPRSTHALDCELTDYPPEARWVAVEGM